MLQKLNERIQGLVAWIIIVLVTITFLLFGIDYYLQSHHDSSVQVEVNGQPISKQSLDSSFRRARESSRSSNLNALSEQQLKQQILNEMIVNNVSVQSARSNGFEVSAAQADSAILNIPQFQEEGHFSSDRYTQVLNNAFFTPESFQKEVRQGMLLNQQRFAFIGTSFALPSDMENFVKLSMQTRDYDFLLIPAAKFLSKNNISEEALARFYDQNKKEFLAPEQISIDYIKLSMQDIRQSIHLSSEQIKQYYDETSSATGKPFAEVQEDIKGQLLAELAQAKYAQLLEKLSDLSYQSPDTLVPAAEALNMKIEKSGLFSRDGTEDLLLKNKQIVQSAFSHDVLELGNNSEPVQFDNDTVVVLRVNKHVLSTERPFNEVKSIIVERLVKEKAADEANRIGKEWLAIGRTDARQLDDLIEKNNQKWQHIVKSTRDADVAPPMVNDLAFRLSHSNEREGLRLANGDYVIVSLKAINDGQLASLDKEQINSMGQQIESNYGVMDYDLYINALMSKAVIAKH